MAKNIIVLCDGTGQKGGINTNTNVYKLFNMLEDRTPRQVVYYDAGIGTGDNKIISQIFGIGFARNMLDCYQFIFEQYEAGDHIYLFGFSRGAATVRSLSAFIELFGILPHSRKDLIAEAFEIYKIRTKNDEAEAGLQFDQRKKLNRREEKAKEFIDRHHTMWTRVKFLGVWDTVAALGMSGSLLDMAIDRIWPHTFHNYNLCPGVDYARHALSIDEERKTFHPQLWAPLRTGENPDRLKQVWFCGVHTDVGGGYPEEELSFYSLQWMIREAREKGLLIHEDSPAWKKFQQVKYNIEGVMHNELLGFKGRLFRRATRTWPSEFGAVRLHESVLSRKKNNANRDAPDYKPWILGIEPREIEK
jgi:uncharacterized protein (DUF2235 family)